jgi:gluconokinase
MLVLALESSTSSAKALLFDVKKGVIRTESCPYDPAWCGDGISDTDEVFMRTMEKGRRVADGQTVAAVALGGVWHSIAICDRSMRPAGGTYTWNYMKPSAMCRVARDDAALTDALYQHTGCMPHVTYMRHTLRYLRENGLHLEDKLLPSQAAYNYYQMTGEFVETPDIMSGSGFLNIHNLDYDSLALDYTGIHENQLGKLVTYRDTGALNMRCSKLLGIPAGIPVVPPHADGALNQIANGAATVGYMTLSVGTSGAIRMTTERPVLPQGHQLWCYYGVMDWMSGWSRPREMYQAES